MLPKVPFAPFWILIRGPHERPDFKFQVIMLGEIDFLGIFVIWGLIFTQPNTTFVIFGFFSEQFLYLKWVCLDSEQWTS